MLQEQPSQRVVYCRQLNFLVYSCAHILVLIGLVRMCVWAGLFNVNVLDAFVACSQYVQVYVCVCVCVGQR